jgi:hypothetical protein
LVIDTVVCLTLAKWETVSGQFGGYLSNRPLSLSLIAFQRKLLTTAPSVRTASLPVGARLGVGLGVQGLSVNWPRSIGQPGPS